MTMSARPRWPTRDSVGVRVPGSLARRSSRSASRRVTSPSGSVTAWASMTPSAPSARTAPSVRAASSTRVPLHASSCTMVAGHSIQRLPPTSVWSAPRSSIGAAMRVKLLSSTMLSAAPALFALVHGSLRSPSSASVQKCTDTGSSAKRLRMIRTRCACSRLAPPRSSPYPAPPLPRKSLSTISLSRA